MAGAARRPTEWQVLRWRDGVADIAKAIRVSYVKADSLVRLAGGSEANQEPMRAMFMVVTVAKAGRFTQESVANAIRDEIQSGADGLEAGRRIRHWLLDEIHPRRRAC